MLKKKHVRLKVAWRNGEISWTNMNALKEQDPWIILSYIDKRKLHQHPEFKWSKQYFNNLEQSCNIFLSNTTDNQGMKFKFGVQIPKNAGHAKHLDHVNNNTLWADTTAKELNSLNSFHTFKVLENDEPLPEGYAKIPYMLIFDCKFDGRRKCRLVLGGHRTPDVPPEETYSGVIAMETVRTAFVLGAINNLDVCAADISTAFLHGKTREKVYIIAGPEFGKDAGKRLIVDRSCYGLKSSPARFHERLSQRLREMGFRPSKADFDLWMRSKGDHYEYLATYVDDLLVFSREPLKIIEEVKKDFLLTEAGKPEYYQGGDFHTTKEIDGIEEANDDDTAPHLSSKWLKEGVKTAFSARTYISQCMSKLETMMNKTFSTKNSPMSDLYHPETDDSPLLNKEDHSKFRSLIGCANWLITLGRFDINYAVNTLSRFSMAPRQGHLEAMIRVFGYLKKFNKGAIENLLRVLTA